MAKLFEHLNNDQINKLNKITKPNNKSKKRKRSSKKKEEKVNWHEIMGTNNRGLKRGKGGAWRNG